MIEVVSQDFTVTVVTDENENVTAYTEYTEQIHAATQSEVNTGTASGVYVSPATLANSTQWATKQDTLVSGTNIKTINGSSILGSGDLTVSGGGVSGLTATRVPYAQNATTLIDDSNLTWDNTNKILNIGTSKLYGSKFIISSTGNDYNTDIGSGSETGPTLYLARQFASGTTNEHGLIIRDLFQSESYAYAAFDNQTQFATGKTYNHYSGFQERGELLGTANVTNYYSILSNPTVGASGTIGTLYHLRINHNNIHASATISSATYGVRVETLKGPASGKWAFYSDVDNSYFGGRVNIGTNTSSTRSLNVFNSTPSIGIGISTTEHLLISVASATNNGITGSATGDAIIRKPANKFLFSADDGTTIHFSISSTGILSNVKHTFFTSTTSSASINIPHGSAPSSPSDGDVWTTTSGIYVRINGSTIGPLS